MVTTLDVSNVNIVLQNFAGLSFGELEISYQTVVILILLTLSVFLGVAISSFKLIQSILDSKEEN